MSKNQDATQNGVGPQREIETQPMNITKEAAIERANGGLLSRLKRFSSDTEIVHVERRFKPFYRFEATLRKSFFRGDDIVHEGMIVVDSSTGVARPILKQQVETTIERIAEDDLLGCDIDENEALAKAQRQKLRTQNRDGGEIELNEDAQLVYKPVWLVEFANGDVQAIDATNGRVYDDMTLF